MLEARAAAKAAAQWLVLLDSGRASAADHARLAQWRQAHSAHEQVWQKALALRERVNGLPPALSMAALERPEQGRRQLLKGGLGLALLLPTAWYGARQLPLAAWAADVASATGEQRQLTLAGGAQLWLDTASAVNVDAAMRQVQLLRGALALRNPSAQRWSVQAGSTRTLFNAADVEVRLDAERCEVGVRQGQARVSCPGYAELTLNGGERVSIGANGPGPVQRFDPALPGWREGVLVANDQPLGDFLRELARYRPGLLRWDAALARLRVTGSFRLNDTDQVLALLAASLPLQVHRRTRYWVTLEPVKKTA